MKETMSMIIFIYAICGIPISLLFACGAHKFEYSKWLKNKNSFGKLYTSIAIVFTLPIFVMSILEKAIVYCCVWVYFLGIKEKH